MSENPEWEVVLTFSGSTNNIIILRYRDEAEAREVFDTVSNAMWKASSVLALKDVMGDHTVSTYDLKSASVMHRKSAMAIALALQEEERDVRMG